ncbi:nuclear transport factor 2 family protein [Spirosoma montaniterrae]|uniref:DUF4440 domain-containing protein n=1 Tax=Spirosoma montaniterrae TaxID=1178516 RepID=A0A1P9X0M8_9BACT|nr:nuclear transport factor 2 family protein [Spirosoma montaniterrae]AQG81172.1 DUF4440 domain-containing protein [Spirosoma montaniterrae]
MKSILLLVAGLVFATATFAQTAPTDPMQDPTALTNAFFKAMLDEDGTLNKYLTSDFSITSFDGQTVDGDLLAQGVGGGFVIVETATISDARTRQYNNDAAVTTGNWKAKGSIQGQGFDSNVAFSVTSVKQGTGWKIANIQFTAAK